MDITSHNCDKTEYFTITVSCFKCLYIFFYYILIQVKEIINKKKQWPSEHSRCRWVCFFIGEDLHNLLTNGSSAVNGCRREWESKQLIKTSHNPHNSSPSINIVWSEKLHVCMLLALLVNYCDFFYQLFGLSLWRHPLTVFDVIKNFSKSVLMKKQTHLQIGWHRGE